MARGVGFWHSRPSVKVYQQVTDGHSRFWHTPSMSEGSVGSMCDPPSFCERAVDKHRTPAIPTPGHFQTRPPGGHTPPFVMP